jgi:opine dehydrogenase
MNKEIRWAIVGGGNGGQSLAGHLGLMGYPVRIYDIFPETIAGIAGQGGIHLDGVVEGFGSVELATTDIQEAISGADIVVVVAPATAHRDIAKACAAHLVEGQIVLLHPGATCGALEFRQVLDQEGGAANLAIAETNSLIYACRSPRPGFASIFGIKQDLIVATFPARENPRVLKILQEPFPQIKPGKNVLETSLGNANAVMHPGPTILNTSMIESEHSWRYYLDGITPTIGEFVEDLDRERLNLAKSFGIELTPIREWYRIAYGVVGDSLSEVVRKNPAYAKIQGQKELRTRYLCEDIPTGLVPMVGLAQLKGVAVDRMELVAKMGGYLLKEDFFASGRTLESLGIADMSAVALERYLENGERELP